MIITLDLSQLEAHAAAMLAFADTVEPTAERLVAKTAYDIVATAQTLVPVDTGFLRSSLSADVQGLSASIGPTAHYGHYVEFGTSRMAPRPYLRPAYDMHVPKLAEALGQLGERVFG